MLIGVQNVAFSRKDPAGRPGHNTGLIGTMQQSN